MTIEKKSLLWRLNKSKNMITTKNKNGTFDLSGLTEREAFAILALTGETSYEIGYSLYKSILSHFPKFVEIYNKEGGVFKNGLVGVPIADKFDKIFNLNKSVVAPVPVESPKISTFESGNKQVLVRDSKGRFIGKKWVARFSYPSSQYPYQYIARTVIVEKNSDGRKGPNSSPTLPIKGRDAARNNEFRNFSPYKIVGVVNWSYEYPKV